MGKYPVRLAIELDEQVCFKLRRLLPHGAKRQVFEALAVQVADGVEKFGQLYLTMIVDKVIGIGFNHARESAEKIGGLDGPQT
jgi:hypothetical protein